MWDPHNYQIASELFLKLLGAVYVAIWLPYLFQIKGLLGTNGILPISRYLHNVKAQRGPRAYRLAPTLFWFNNSNIALLALVWAGLICSILLMLGVLPSLMLLLLYVLYLSLVAAGQNFLSFGWDVLILEITANSFLLSLTIVPNAWVWISINLVLFRLHFQGGAVKLQSHDPNWRNLTAVAYHYFTQPLPNATAWYVHKLPMWFHRISCALALFIELIVPFAFFGNAEMRLAAWVLVVALQILIWATGNFSYLNHLTVALATILVADSYLVNFFTLPEAPEGEIPMLLNLFLSCTGGLLIILQLANLWEHFTQRSVAWLLPIQRFLSPYHLANRYGLFAVMTTKRYEIVVEGSEDGKLWKEYQFKYKPGELNRRPRRISPLQPRLDWQLWFLPFGRYEHEVWFHNFLVQLLHGEKDVLQLLRHSPFPDQPPRYIRAIAYDYEFSTAEQKKQTGSWWTRKFAGNYSPTLQLR